MDNSRLTEQSSKKFHFNRLWIVNGFIFSMVWVVLTQGELSAWVIGIIFVPFATWCSIGLFSYKSNDDKDSVALERGNLRSRILSLIDFIPFFLWQSLKGGVDSALLAISPIKQQYSDFIIYETVLPSGSASIFFNNTICLLPGTISTNWEENFITIHVLDNRTLHYQDLKMCEQKIANLFGLKVRSESQ